MKALGKLPLRRLAAIAVLAAVSGCGSGSPLHLAPVRGTVTYRGEPLRHGEVVFAPQGATPGPQAVGHIRPDGSFRMRTAGRNGAVLGNHVATVHCRRKVSEEEARNLVIGESLIPDRYWKEDQTPLRFEVKEGSNVYPIVLE